LQFETEHLETIAPMSDRAYRRFSKEVMRSRREEVQLKVRERMGMCG
jgi:hypothetical protein